jgi:hypothetical protein
MNELLMLRTALQYFSGIKMELIGKYRNNDIWKNESWCTSINKGIERNISERCFNLGISICEKAPPIGRELLKRIACALILQNDIEGYEKRAVIVMTFLAVGRSGEVASTSWNSAYWNLDDENLTLDWNERKTNRQTQMNFFCDCQSYEIDFYHSIACYILLGGGNKSLNRIANVNSNFVFPFLSGLSNSGPAHYVTNIIQSVYKDRII